MYELITILSLVTIGLSGLLILTGIVLIKLGKREWHKRAMLTASFLALIFVVLYLIKSSLYPPKQYTGEYKTLYYFVLWSHTILAIINFPLAVYTVYLGLKGLYDKHRKIAPITAAVWIYVAVTGWMIYFFLN
ncbi:DUF420 domain-containing protein [Aquifex aeolicus]|uniref:DUF420 domain-containing protein n=1 Tax=Aquifex aeolicus (strain VF5) TaxID=224324 RepID=O66546_AQUAE|nr:DUF420 domain-containing protein [Aquifex aeolicus]AAC06515.1 hypothetical protein aq_156 [Aquifex aeolicus VF5]